MNTKRRFNKISIPKGLLVGGIFCLLFSITWVQADRIKPELQNTELDGKSTDELIKAKAVIEKGIKENPGNSELYLHLGLVERKLEHVEEAQKAFEQAAALNPKNANAHFMLGLIYEKKKMKNEALAAWEACRFNATDEKMREIAEKHLGHLKNQ